MLVILTADMNEFDESSPFGLAAPDEPPPKRFGKGLDFFFPVSIFNGVVEIHRRKKVGPPKIALLGGPWVD